MSIQNIKNELNLFYPDLKIKDWKLPENRKDLFNHYFKWRVLSHDLDHTHYCSVLTEDYDFERKAWFSFLFGMTYRTPQAFCYSEIFDHPNNFSLKEVEDWHSKNWKRTTYGTDARYNKGHFVKQFESVKNWLNGKTFKEKFDEIVIDSDSNLNFWKLYKEVLSLYKYGRMTGWLTLQCLYDICKLNIDPKEIMLEGFSPNNDSSLGSIWNGLCAYENKHEKMVGGKYGNYITTKEDIEYAKEKLLEYTEEAENFSGFRIDSFRKESIWCQYKRLFGESGSKEYPGHSSGDATSRYLYYRENWKEVDWGKFRKALRQQPGNVCGLTYISWLNELFGETGFLMNLHEISDDFLNPLEYIELELDKYRVKEIWMDDNLSIPENFNFSEMIKDSPKYYLQI